MSDTRAQLVEALERQFDQYEPYRTLCEMEGVARADLRHLVDGGDYVGVPTVPAGWFKRDKGKGLYLRLADQSRPGGWLVSSSTSGDPSYTWRTAADRQAIVDAFEGAYGNVPAGRSLAFSPTAGFLRKVGQRFAIDEHAVEFYAVVPTETADAHFVRMDAMAKLNLLKTMWSMVRSRGKGRPVLDLLHGTLQEAIAEARAQDTPLVFSASVLMLHPMLRDLPDSYELGSNAWFLTGAGGWDGAKGITHADPIDKPTYVRQMQERFRMSPGTASTNFWDIYGTTENGKAFAGPYDPEREDFVFRVPPDSVKMVVLDPVSGQAAEPGQRGFPRFLTAVGIEGFAGAAIQQNDLVTVVSTWDDGSVRGFTHVGRADGASAGAVGCAFEMVEGVQR